MKHKAHLSITVLIFCMVILACSLPVLGQPQATIFPEPNLTLTALFAQATILTQAAPQVTASLNPTASFTPENTITVTPSISPSPSFSPTITITNTPVPPTVVAIPIPQRLGGSFAANYLSVAPVIDGNWDEWNTTQYPIGAIVFGRSNWTDAADLEGAFRIGWDYTYLYIAVKVKDDTYVQNATGQDIYKGDSLEILLDTDLYGDFYVTSLSPDDYQLGISPGKPDTSGAKEAFLWFPNSIAGSRPSVLIGSIGGSGLYRVEARIPWSVLGVSSPGLGAHYGFVISVSDNDNASSNVQQSLVSSDPNRVLTNPTTWGEVVLSN
jgi:hypothetical protein